MAPTLVTISIIAVMDALVVTDFEHIAEPMLIIAVLDCFSIDFANSRIIG